MGRSGYGRAGGAPQLREGSAPVDVSGVTSPPIAVDGASAVSTDSPVGLTCSVGVSPSSTVMSSYCELAYPSA